MITNIYAKFEVGCTEKYLASNKVINLKDYFMHMHTQARTHTDSWFKHYWTMSRCHRDDDTQHWIFIFLDTQREMVLIIHDNWFSILLECELLCTVFELWTDFKLFHNLIWFLMLLLSPTIPHTLSQLKFDM